MYPHESKHLQGLRTGRWSGVGPNVFFLGLTSFLTDISSEMVVSILPIYMVIALRLTPLQYGFIDGLYQGAAALARLAGGLMADRWQRNREVAAAGYGLSAFCKLGLLAAGSSWGLLASAVAVDRIGKGIRTAPRDALISLSSAPQRLGLAFGVHRAFDTAGALLGPLLAFAILAALPNAYDVVFVTSFFVAIIGLAALLLFVRNVPTTQAGSAQDRPVLADAIGLLRQPAFRGVVLCSAALGLVTVADSFFFLALQRRTSMPMSYFPLLYVATAATYLLLAIPAGRLGDRIGRGRVFLLGHAFLLGACVWVGLLASDSGLVEGLLALALLGAYYACTDGVLMAAASSLLPDRLRASGLAMLTTATGLARLTASIVFGAVWNAWSIEVAFGVYAVGLCVVLLLTARLWIGREHVN